MMLCASSGTAASRRMASSSSQAALRAGGAVAGQSRAATASACGLVRVGLEQLPRLAHGMGHGGGDAGAHHQREMGGAGAAGPHHAARSRQAVEQRQAEIDTTLVAGRQDGGAGIAPDQAEIDVEQRAVPHPPEAAQRVAPVAAGRIEHDVAGLHEDVGGIDGAVDRRTERQVEQEQARMLEQIQERVVALDPHHARTVEAVAAHGIGRMAHDLQAGRRSTTGQPTMIADQPDARRRRPSAAPRAGERGLSRCRPAWVLAGIGVLEPLLEEATVWFLPVGADCIGQAQAVPAASKTAAAEERRWHAWNGLPLMVLT